MNDFVISQVRTYVPVAVGVVVSWLSLKGVKVDSGSVVALASGLTGVIAGLYYFIIRILEKKWPQAGVLLGKAVTPTYVPPVATTTSATK